MKLKDIFYNKRGVIVEIRIFSPQKPGHTPVSVDSL
jgi:hypothetical protein